MILVTFVLVSLSKLIMILLAVTEISAVLLKNVSEIPRKAIKLQGQEK